MKTTLHIADMECPSCSGFLERMLKNASGVTQTRVNLKKRTLQITYDETQLSIERICASIQQYGYHPEALAARENKS